MSSPTASSIASTAFSTGCQIAAVAQQVQEAVQPSVPVQSHPIQEDSDSEGALTPCRKRKAEGVSDTPGKRCKDGAGRRAPLRVSITCRISKAILCCDDYLIKVVPDNDNNRQSAVVTSKLKGGKHGVVWGANEKENGIVSEKENECVGKIGKTDKIDRVVTTNVGDDVISQHTIRSHSHEPLAPATRDFTPSLLSATTLDATTLGNTTQETQAGSESDRHGSTDRQAGSDTDRQAGSDTDRQAGGDTDTQAGSDSDTQAGSDTDSPETDSVQTNECGLDSENSAGCVDTMSWTQIGRTGLWQLSCDGSEAVPIQFWAGMPMHGPALNPVPIVRNHAPGDQKILVLDMDETLIHASAQELPEFDFKVIDPFGICASKISVKKRPHVEYFLEQVAKLYKVVIFTAGTKEYATQVLDQLDPSGTLFAHRLFRDHCVLMGHFMVKDLRLITRNLSQVIIVDNTPSAYLLQRENGIHIPSYFGTDGNDCELLQLLPLLEKLADVEDVRPLIIRHATAPYGSQFQLNPNAAEFQPVASPQPNGQGAINSAEAANDSAGLAINSAGTTRNSTGVASDSAEVTSDSAGTANNSAGDANQFQFNPHAAEYQP